MYIVIAEKKSRLRDQTTLPKPAPIAEKSYHDSGYFDLSTITLAMTNLRTQQELFQSDPSLTVPDQHSPFVHSLSEIAGVDSR